jgi:hypothetical protein
MTRTGYTIIAAVALAVCIGGTAVGVVVSAVR